MSKFEVGDHIVYHKQKVSRSPGPRAVDVTACEHGDNYWYIVDKYWTVAAVFDDGTIEVVTRRGKRHRLEANDRRLRKARLLDELLHHSRFPDLEAVEDPLVSKSAS